MLHKDFIIADNPALDRFLGEVEKILTAGTPFGTMFAKNITQTVTIAAANVSYEITAGFTPGLLNMMEVVGGYYFKIIRPGTYFIVYHISMRGASPNDAIEAGLMVNHTELIADAGSHTTVFAANKASAVAASGITFLQKGDTVSLYVRNQSGANNVTLEHMGACIVRLGVGG
jgi:hypothetical protein